MSGSNANAYAESRRLLLGLGDLYINNEFVGNLKDAVTLTVTREYAYQRAGNNIADQKGEATREEVTLEATICDLKLAQLRRAFGIDTAVDATTDKVIRNREVLKLTGVTFTSPAETMVSGSIKVCSLDRKTDYVVTTDWLLSGGDIRRVSGGGISDGQFVALEYNFSDAGAQSLAFGGETKAPNTFRMDFTHKDSTGKLWQITFFKAMTMTEFEMAFNERESGDYTVHNISFKALVDTTKPEGQNLMEIVQEDAAV
jgi:hypothetical protein